MLGCVNIFLQVVRKVVVHTISSFISSYSNFMDALREVHLLFQQKPQFTNISGWPYLLMRFMIGDWLEKYERCYHKSSADLNTKLFPLDRRMLNELIENEISYMLTLFFFSFLNFVKMFTLSILRRVEMAKGWQYCKFCNRQRF